MGRRWYRDMAQNGLLQEARNVQQVARKVMGQGVSREAEMYNGYESVDAFHAAMRARWAEMLSTPEGREAHRKAYGPGSTSHAACDHAEGICIQVGGQ